MAHVYVGASLLAISDAEKSIASKLAPTGVAIASVGWVEPAIPINLAARPCWVSLRSTQPTGYAVLAVTGSRSNEF